MNKLTEEDYTKAIKANDYKGKLVDIIVNKNKYLSSRKHLADSKTVEWVVPIQTIDYIKEILNSI